MEILRREPTHLKVKVKAHEVNELFTSEFTTITNERVRMSPVSISTGILQVSNGDTSTDQDKPNSGAWDWRDINLAEAKQVVHAENYLYFRATKDAVIVFSSNMRNADEEIPGVATPTPTPTPSPTPTPTPTATPSPTGGGD